MKNSRIKNKLASFVLVFFIMLFVNKQAFSQNETALSRVAITVENSKTNIWLSDFPKNTSVMLVDADDNLLGIITTNKFGAAYTFLNKSVPATIIARTLNGDVNATNKAVLKEDQPKDDLAFNTLKKIVKA